MQLKANSIQHLTDARYFAAQGVDWLGVCLDLGSASYIAPKKVQDIRGWLSGPQFVGEFSAMQTADEIAESVELLALDAVQIHAFMPLADIAQRVGVPVLQTHSIATAADALALIEQAPAQIAWAKGFILQVQPDWQSVCRDAALLSALQTLCSQYPIWLDIAFQPEALAELIATLAPECLCLQGGEEERVGYKSFDELDAIFEQLNP